VRRPEGRRPLEILAYGWNDNTKVDRIHRLEGSIKDLPGSGKRHVAGF
jgi:hypothetical protein